MKRFNRANGLVQAMLQRIHRYQFWKCVVLGASCTAQMSKAKHCRTLYTPKANSRKMNMPGDSIRDLLIPQLEVTNNLWRGHVFTIPKRSRSQNCQVMINQKKSGLICSFFWVFWTYGMDSHPTELTKIHGSWTLMIPIWSMYGIFAYIWLIF